VSSLSGPLRGHCRGVRSITERDTTRQNLTPRQLRAIESCLAGRRDEPIAKAVGVSRQTVNTWRNHDQTFIDELQCRRNAMTRTMHDKLLALAWKAIDVVSQAVEKGDARVALEIGKSLGLFAPVQFPEGPETIEQLEEHRATMDRVASEMATQSEGDKERRAHRQARAEAEQAYTGRLIEEMTPMDVGVYERRLAELLAQEGSAQ
jgi:hypothetical protein